jgi:hypothetical protein
MNEEGDTLTNLGEDRKKWKLDEKKAEKRSKNNHHANNTNHTNNLK